MIYNIPPPPHTQTCTRAPKNRMIYIDSRIILAIFVAYNVISGYCKSLVALVFMPFFPPACNDLHPFGVYVQLARVKLRSMPLLFTYDFGMGHLNIIWPSCQLYATLKIYRHYPCVQYTFLFFHLSLKNVSNHLCF